MWVRLPGGSLFLNGRRDACIIAVRECDFGAFCDSLHELSPVDAAWVASQTQWILAGLGFDEEAQAFRDMLERLRRSSQIDVEVVR